MSLYQSFITMPRKQKFSVIGTVASIIGLIIAILTLLMPSKSINTINKATNGSISIQQTGNGRITTNQKDQ